MFNRYFAEKRDGVKKSDAEQAPPEAECSWRPFLVVASHGESDFTVMPLLWHCCAAATTREALRRTLWCML